jgi:hypothetical protein
MIGDDKNSVLVDGMSPVTSKREGTVVGFTDICETPGPGGPVPIPHPNIARSSDLQNGSKTVSINGASVCLSSSCLGTLASLRFIPVDRWNDSAGFSP